MIETLLLVLFGSVVLAAAVWLVIYKAMGNLIDWVILTFGNPEAVARLKRERGWNSTDE